MATLYDFGVTVAGTDHIDLPGDGNPCKHWTVDNPNKFAFTRILIKSTGGTLGLPAVNQFTAKRISPAEVEYTPETLNLPVSRVAEAASITLGSAKDVIMTYEVDPHRIQATYTGAANRSSFCTSVDGTGTLVVCGAEQNSVYFTVKDLQADTTRTATLAGVTSDTESRIVSETADTQLVLFQPTNVASMGIYRVDTSTAAASITLLQAVTTVPIFEGCGGSAHGSVFVSGSDYYVIPNGSNTFQTVAMGDYASLLGVQSSATHLYVLWLATDSTIRCDAYDTALQVTNLNMGKSNVAFDAGAVCVFGGDTVYAASSASGQALYSKPLAGDPTGTSWTKVFAIDGSNYKYYSLQIMSTTPSVTLYAWQSNDNGENTSFKEITVTSATTIDSETINSQAYNPELNTRIGTEGLVPGSSVFTMLTTADTVAICQNQTFPRTVTNTSVPTPTPTPGPTPTVSPTAVPPTGPPGPTSTLPKKKSGLSSSAKLGIGLGVGIPIGILMIVLIVVLVRRSSRRKSA